MKLVLGMAALLMAGTASAQQVTCQTNFGITTCQTVNQNAPRATGQSFNYNQYRQPQQNAGQAFNEAYALQQERNRIAEERKRLEEERQRLEEERANQ